MFTKRFWFTSRNIFFTSQTQTLVTVLNVNKNSPRLTSFLALDSHRTAVKISEVAPPKKKNCCLLKHRFTILTNKILCSTVALYVTKHQCCNYTCRSTTKINRFRAVGNSHRTSHWTRRRKTGADSRFLMNKLIRSILRVTWQKVANIGIEIIAASFRTTANFFWKRTRTWSPTVLEFRMISRVTKQRLV